MAEIKESNIIADLTATSAGKVVKLTYCDGKYTCTYEYFSDGSSSYTEPKIIDKTNKAPKESTALKVAEPQVVNP